MLKSVTSPECNEVLNKSVHAQHILMFYTVIHTTCSNCCYTVDHHNNVYVQYYAPVEKQEAQYIQLLVAISTNLNVYYNYYMHNKNNLCMTKYKTIKLNFQGQ